MADGTTEPPAPQSDPDREGWTIAEPSAPEYKREIARLAALPPIEYDRERKAAAEGLGIRAATLDSAVEALRPAPEAGVGRGVVLPEAKPWPDPVPGRELLDAITAAVRRHVILRPTAAEAVALWIAHTWVAERFQHTPRLGITSPAKRCGKSTLLDVLHATCCRPLKADNISAAGVYRTVEALAPLTLLLDEADSFLKENEELRGVLNSGFERSGNAIRVLEVNGEHQPVQFHTFAPVALAGIGALPSTLEDRAVPVALQRKGAAETAAKLRAPGARAALADLARKAMRWAMDRGPALDLNPAIPEAMGDREGDIAVPLLSIADDAGGPWPARARAALLDLFGRREAEGGNAETGALLLADLRNLFQDKGAPRLTSAFIIEALGGMEERPWPEWRHGKPISANQLARALAPFGVRPQNIREGQAVVKGYTKDSFGDAWARYLPADPAVPADPFPAPEGAFHAATPLVGGDQSATPLQHCFHSGESANQTATRGKGVAVCNGENPIKNQSCSGVAVQKGGVSARENGKAPDGAWTGSL